jgi:hypothetical protein
MGELLLPSRRIEYTHTTDDGQLLERHSVNLHHAFWKRRDYKTDREKRFRNLKGLVLPLEVKWHRELHANLRPPQKPTVELMDHLIDFSQELDGDHYVRFAKIAKEIIYIAETSSNYGLADIAQSIGSNLLLQTAYIDKGSVRRLDDTRV